MPTPSQNLRQAYADWRRSVRPSGHDSSREAEIEKKFAKGFATLETCEAKLEEGRRRQINYNERMLAIAEEKGTGDETRFLEHTKGIAQTTVTQLRAVKRNIDIGSVNTGSSIKAGTPIEA